MGGNSRLLFIMLLLLGKAVVLDTHFSGWMSSLSAVSPNDIHCLLASVVAFEKTDFEDFVFCC